MKVLYIHQYFRTPEEGGSTRSFYLAQELISKGFTVEVITACNEAKAKTIDVGGIKVHYLPVSYDNSFGYKKRIWSFLRFVILAILKSNEIKSVDICYIMTTPLTTGIIGLYSRWARKIPFIFEVGDLWPEVPIQMGIIKNPILKWSLYKLEKLFYQQAHGMVALSSAIYDYIRNVAPSKPIEVIPNISDCSFFDSEKINSIEVKLNYKIKDEFVISYTGTIGAANHLEYLIEIATISQSLPIKFLIVGEGAEKLKLNSVVKNRGLENIEFHPAIDKQGVKDVLSISDAVYISFSKVEALNTGSPNKLFDGLAAGKMIISNLDGWTKNLIEENQIGFSYNPENPDEFKNKLQPYLAKDSKLSKCQKNARILAMNEFSLEILSERQFDFIEKIISNS